MGTYILGFQEVDQTMAALVGGKGANLGELSLIGGIEVPAGFCVTTDAYKKVTENCRGLSDLLDELSLVRAEDRSGVGGISAKIRSVIENAVIPNDVAEEIAGCLSGFGEKESFAVRSSATAEDLPTASFAGQQDTYLNIIGAESVLKHISRCWASLFTDRAVSYRIQNGFDHRQVQLSVVVQKMVFPEAAGVLFTADPVSGNRKVLSIDASFGLGEALVSGLVNADHYKLREGRIVDKKISAKELAIYPSEEVGTRQQVIREDLRNRQVLTDGQIVNLEQIGRKIEAHFARSSGKLQDNPQDIEWCLSGGVFYIVQSRPITTLFPIPEADDRENHVYVSVGHQQMMTDAMKPLGLSFFLMVTPASMRTAGGRLFVDVTQMLAAPATRENVLHNLGKSDPLIKDALMMVMERGDFIKRLPDEQENNPSIPHGVSQPVIGNDLGDLPETIVTDLIRQNEESIEELKRRIQAKSGSELIDFIHEDIEELKRILFDPLSHRVLMAGINAAFWMNEKMDLWLGDKNAADTLSQSLSNNITSEMGLVLIDVADVIRPYAEVVGYLERLEVLKGEGLKRGGTWLEELDQLDGGSESRAAILAFLERYGMRCTGEIDITRTRWAEKPETLVPLILGNVRSFGHGASRVKFEEGLQKAIARKEDLLLRLRELPDGVQKAEETERMIGLVRRFAGYREYPKYGMMKRFFVYKQALLREARRLADEGVFEEMEDVYYLTLQELGEFVRTGKQDRRMIGRRKEALKRFEKLTPPRVLTSEGEMIRGAYKRGDLPEGAMVGLTVSSGAVEGRALVILNMEDALVATADREDGLILVTAFTDPSWTPLFVSIKGLVTEVGGLMTHGAVIAREYGLPAIVGVENATKLIRNGQRIRLNAADGYVELL
jgi:phosphoenolpyruvate synthase/pyruvate phosphate dikinase